MPRPSLARFTVRTRAALGATLVVAVALVAAGFAVVAVLRGGLAENARLHAETTAREVAAGIVDVPVDEVAGMDALADDEPVQVVDAAGTVLGASRPLRDRAPVADFNRPAESGPRQPPATPSPEGREGQTGDGDDDDGDGDDDDDGGGTTAPPEEPVEVDRNSVTETVPLPVDDDGEVTFREGRATELQDFRLVAVQSVTRDRVPVTVYAGASLAEQEEAVSTVGDAMLIGLPVLLTVVGGVTWLVTRGALRPVEGIRREMAAIAAGTDLSRRVPEPATGDEIARLARTTNETLAALQAAVERQRRFVADASHELRSPIASLRTQLEVAAAHPRLLDLDGAVHDTVRLQDLAADLLLLARLDAGERPGDKRVALDALVREELAQRPADRVPVAVEEHRGPPPEVTGSRGQLVRVLGNLLDNAQRHAEHGVRVGVRREGGQVVLEVADDGAGVPEAERERIFERFVRLDDARSRDDGGAGLGLAIARDVAVRHGGTLTAGRAREGGALFTLRLPAAGT
ncbi:HAMP domain-containing sensor histidine kinase [Streptomyces sp. TRM 70361]|uniref:sensor histidine kinase n=1 Tax=Streptomyces sp. TRM 70361 TaxID=3116553 RepID=UPI002E7BC190|nr:HAMP domain-containing sensor histidine kinase [Streptomyces sp. TRM 70361]MEE1938729.1 HAMP domain-containing sensor histidine kinase [Streptomyces sp. TRM 70361]